MRKKSSSELYFNPHSKPFNISLSEWSAIWWKWIHSIPVHTNPAVDSTGQLCNTSQGNPNVWFLAGTFGGSAVRNCIIPYGKAILFPIITSVYSFVLDPQLKSEEDLTRSVTEDIDKVERLSLTIDEITFKELKKFRVKSKPFDDIIDGVNTRTVSDGYWIFLKPPNAGMHTIYFLGKNIDFFNEVTYHISIRPKL